MDFNSMINLVILLVCLALSAFFSAAETALMSISKIRVRHMIDDEVPGAVAVQRLIENPAKLLSTILIGNNAVNIGASAIGTSLAVDQFGNNGVAIATVVMTIVVLLFAEITPKSLAAKRSEKTALALSKPLSVIVSLLKPIVIVFTYATNILMKLFGIKIDKDKPYITEEELKTIVTVSHEEGVLEVEEKQMIYNVFEFGDMTIHDVMVQRTDIVAFNVSTSYDDIMNTIREEQFSRYPVYQDNIDNIIGIINIKDIAFVSVNNSDFKMENYMRKPYFTFEFKRITELFKIMKKNRLHFAVVLDEYGGTAGIVTIEDLLEEIVGEIKDEYDEHEIEIEVVKDGEYLVYGSTKLTLVGDMLNINLDSEDFDSIGGFIIGQLGRLPKTGEVMEYKDIKFKTEAVERNRIMRVRITKNA